MNVNHRKIQFMETDIYLPAAEKGGFLDVELEKFERWYKNALEKFPPTISIYGFTFEHDLALRIKKSPLVMKILRVLSTQEALLVSEEALFETVDTECVEFGKLIAEICIHGQILNWGDPEGGIFCLTNILSTNITLSKQSPLTI